MELLPVASGWTHECGFVGKFIVFISVRRPGVSRVIDGCSPPLPQQLQCYWKVVSAVMINRYIVRILLNIDVLLRRHPCDPPQPPASID